MTRQKLIVALGVAVFLALTLAGTYYVRRRLLERALLVAMDADDEEMVESLLTCRPSPVHARDRYARTPLRWAAGHGKAEIASLCIARGAEVNSRELGDFTPLHAACTGGYPEVVRVLLENGADPNLADHAGDTPLFHCASEPAVPALLLAFGARVNVRNASGRTPLHEAAERCDDSASLLIAHGADVNARDAIGRTPLHVAAQWGAKASLETLLTRGAEVNVRDAAGQTPLALARLTKSRLEQGLPIDPTVEGITPIPDTRTIDGIIRILVDHGATEQAN